MLSAEEQAQFDARFAALPLLAGAMAGGVLFGALAVALIAGGRPVSPGGARLVETLRWPFYGFLAVAVTAGPPLKERLLGDGALRSSAGAGLEGLMAAIQTRMVVLLALCEACAMPGLALYVLGGRPSDAAPFLLVSLAGFAGLWPRRVHWRERVLSLLGR